jgi:hypothetical protein
MSSQGFINVIVAVIIDAGRLVKAVVEVLVGQGQQLGLRGIPAQDQLGVVGMREILLQLLEEQGRISEIDLIGGEEMTNQT